MLLAMRRHRSRRAGNAAHRPMLAILAVVAFARRRRRARKWISILAEYCDFDTVFRKAASPSYGHCVQWKCYRYAVTYGHGVNILICIGGVCFPILFNHLQPRIGFRWSTWVIALIMLITLIVPLLAMRMRFRPLKARQLFDAKAWAEPPFSLWACYLFLSLLGLYLPSFYIQLYGVGVMGEDLAIYLLPLLNAGSFFGRIVST